MLLEYQGVVVHDLRGELNALLLTVDFLRRQLSTRPEVASLFGETLGDLDQVRVSLNRTLNQLDLVGHARKTVAKKAAGELASHNLSDVVREVLQQHIVPRAVRRRIAVQVPPASDLSVMVDPVLLHLSVQRVLFAMIELGRDSNLEVTIQPAQPADSAATEGFVQPMARLCIRYSTPQKASSETLEKLNAADNGETTPTPPLTALRLTRCLAEMMNGSLTVPEEGELHLNLPTAGQ